MTLPDPIVALRHRPPAVLVERVVERTGTRLTASAAHAGWSWPQLLEGCAQAAGLLAGTQADGLGSDAVIAEYAATSVHVLQHEGAPRFTAWIDRRVLGFWRCRIEARAADGTLLLDGHVTLAPPVGPEAS